MVNWKNTKCGTCAIQRQKPICNSCMNYHFYRPMTNAQKIRSMTDEELAEFLYDTNHYFENNEYLVRFGGEIVQDEEISILDWLQSEVEGVTENE